MTTDYIYIPMAFDREQFAHDLREFRSNNGLTQAQGDELLGVTCFQTYEYTGHDLLPTMRNFLSLCNMLDADPRKYFVLDNGRRK